MIHRIVDIWLGAVLLGLFLGENLIGGFEDAGKVVEYLHQGVHIGAILALLYEGFNWHRHRTGRASS